MKTKPCSSCKERKKLHEFYENKALTDGHENTCKVCFRKRSKLWRLRNIAHVREMNRIANRKPKQRAYRAAWVKTPTGSASHKRTTARWRKRNKLKTRAHKKLWTAIRSGVVIRQRCEVCNVKKVHAHHSDYSKPLDVKWLCPKHHMALHGLERRKPIPYEAANPNR